MQRSHHQVSVTLAIISQPFGWHPVRFMNPIEVAYCQAGKSEWPYPGTKPAISPYYLGGCL